MSVHIPPKVAACDIGIKTRLGLAPVRRHTSMTTGIKTATAAVLLTKAEIELIITIITMVRVSSEFPIGVSSRRAIYVRAPVRSTAADKTNTAATEIVAGWLNPENASYGVNTPVSSNASSA